MEATLQKLFNTVSFEAISSEKLDEMVRAYHYFAPLQYFLAIKLKSPDKPGFEIQAGKAGLYFNNPLWFKEQLKGWKSVNPVVTELEKPEDPEESNPDEEKEITDNLPPLNIKFSVEPVTQAAPHQAEVQKEEIPIFQAYHTVDYFASQGIKISADMLQKDKLGHQLRSFTDWLRTMKKIPSAAGDKQQGDAADPRIMRFAETSLREGEVVTEAMAEVLLKQGKRSGAIDIYEKLSLLNPHKSAYFAALIEKLKPV